MHASYLHVLLMQSAENVKDNSKDCMILKTETLLIFYPNNLCLDVILMLHAVQYAYYIHVEVCHAVSIFVSKMNTALKICEVR